MIKLTALTYDSNLCTSNLMAPSATTLCWKTSLSYLQVSIFQATSLSVRGAILEQGLTSSTEKPSERGRWSARGVWL
ncbi:MAG: hypothetical protein ABFD82_20195 [Syntrophaceae bacterium]